jgi:glycosyltransferase involved in cell wall biosynthesis
MLRALYPIYNTGNGVSYTCLSLCEHLGGDMIPVEAWFPASEKTVRHDFIRNAYPGWAMPLIYRLPNPVARLARKSERAFVKALRHGDIAYLWPGVSLETYERIKEKGNTIVSELINCHTQYAKRILDDEYARIGWKGSHGITMKDAAREQAVLGLSDFIYAPNPFVIESLLDAGIPQEKILPASYGWDPQRMQGTATLRKKGPGFTAVFVGRLGVRKGIHLLLEAWQRADIQGELLLAGVVPPDVEEQLSQPLARPDIIRLGHTTDIGSVYRSADVFVFGSLEEGGPMVTFEAMGCGLPVIISPMGASCARHGMDGFVIDPHDIDGWVAALRQLAEDKALRDRMGASARERAQEFTWEKVAARRRDVLMNALQRTGL